MAGFCTVLVLFANLFVGTWNLRWFPSGRAEHRAEPQVEAQNVDAAAATVRETLAQRKSGDHVILFFQELRSEAACSNLVAKIGDGDLKLASVSGFRNFDNRLGWQQNGIATDLPVLEANWSYWKRSKKVFPPRGYAYALLDGGKDGLIACYCVHLKSNYGATTPEEKRSNREKREVAVDQLVAATKKIKAPDGRRVERMLIAGDFNTDPFAGAFKEERTIQQLVEAGYVNCFEGAPPEARGTHPSAGNFPDSTLDFIFHRGFGKQQERGLSPDKGQKNLSDHRMVWLRLK